MKSLVGLDDCSRDVEEMHGPEPSTAQSRAAALQQPLQCLEELQELLLWS